MKLSATITQKPYSSQKKRNIQKKVFEAILVSNYQKDILFENSIGRSIESKKVGKCLINLF